MKFSFIFLLFFSANIFANENLETAKRECSEIGFKVDTDKYRECVLELFSRSKSKVTKRSSPPAQTQQRQTQRRTAPQPRTEFERKCVGFGFVMGTTEIANCVAQLNQLQSQQAMIDQQNKRQKNRDLGKFLMEFGLGIAQGDYSGRNNSAPQTNFIEPSTRIILPNGDYVTCQKRTRYINCY